jgi:hypothetical protein
MLITMCASAQYTSDELEMPGNLNTIGTNLTPAVVVFMNAFSMSPRYSLTYKRQVDVSKKLRITGYYEIRDRYEESLSEGQVIDFSDTTITYRIDHRDHYVADVRIGLEWFKPNRATSMVYGIDLLAGIATELDGYRDIPRYETEIGFVPSPFVAETSYEQEIKYLVAGFDFSIGQKLNASDKLNFVIQWTPEFHYLLPIQEKYSDITQRDRAPSDSFEFRLRGIEVYANYLF